MSSIEKNTHIKRASATERHDRHAMAEDRLFANLYERHPDWPHIELSFYFSAHVAPQDMKDVAQHIDATDVYFFESAPREDEWTSLIEEVSQHPQHTLDEYLDKVLIYNDIPIRGTIWEPVVRSLYGTGKAIGTIDIGGNAGEFDLAQELIDAYSEPLPTNGSFDQALETYRTIWEQRAHMQNKREEIMVDRFEDELDLVFELNPELKHKENLKVLVSVGSVHTRLRHIFTANGMESKRSFSDGSPYIYSYELELMRTIQFGKEPTQELLKRAYAENLVGSVVQVATRGEKVPINDYLMYGRVAAATLTDEEIEELFTLNAHEEPLVRPIDSMLIQHGMGGLPRTHAEIKRENEKAYRGKKRALAKAAIGAGV